MSAACLPATYKSSVAASFIMNNSHSQKLVLWSLISFISTLVASIGIPPSQTIGLANITPLNATDLDGSVLNLTSLGAIDPAFGFLPFFGQVKLAPLACLMSSVNAALELALGDFQGVMPATIFKLDSYPQVEISVYPDEAGSMMPRKYVIWGINIGIDLMIKNVKFTEAIFVISYRGHGIGAIQYTMPGTPASISSNTLDRTLSATQTDETMSLFNDTLAFLQNAPQGNITSAANDPQFRAEYTLTGSSLTIYEIFYAALDMLRELAEYKRTVRLDNDSTFIRSAGIEITTIDPNSPSRTVRNPPYFQAEWLMRALAQTPAYMLEQRSFREVDMELYVDNIKVGLVLMRKRLSKDSGQPALNATIS